MAIPTNRHIDPLSTRNLRGPLLNEYYGSAQQRQDVMAIAEEIKRRYLAALGKHNDTGNLARSAKVTAHRSAGHQDRRYEAEFSVGGGRVDYADDIEREYHLLANVLREMGYNTGDRVDGPQGKIAPAHREPPERKDVAAPRKEPEDEPTPAERTLGLRVSRRTYNNALSDLVSDFAKENPGLGEPQYGAKSRVVKFENVPHSVAQEVARHLDALAVSFADTDDADRRADSRAVRKDYDALRQALDAPGDE